MIKYRLKKQNNWYKLNAKKYYIRCNPGKYGKQYTSNIPVAIVLKKEYDLNTRKVDSLLKSNLVKVNNKIVKSRNYPLSGLDILNYDNKYYQVTLNKKYNIKNIKKPIMYAKCTSITWLKNDVLQINCKNGFNYIITKLPFNFADIRNYTLVKDLESQEVKLIEDSNFNSILVIKGKYKNNTYKDYVIENNFCIILGIRISKEYCLFFNE
jgi:ribosomal protein S4E